MQSGRAAAAAAAAKKLRLDTPRSGDLEASPRDTHKSPWAKQREDAHAADLSWRKWLVLFQHSPTQPTAQLAPATFLLRFIWIIALFLTLQNTLPITDVSVSTQGVVDFANKIYFENMEGDRQQLADVDTLDDMVLYQRALVASLFPQHQYDESHRGRLQQYVLRVDRLMNSVVVSQRRVEKTNCAYKNMESLYPICYEDLSVRPDLEITSDYQGHEYNGDLGGFMVKLPLNRTKALRRFDALVEDHFWDEATRESSLRFAFMNAPGHFSGYYTLTFSLSAYGRVTHSADVYFLRLQPYSEEVDGHRLVYAQVLALGLLLGLCAEIVLGFAYQPHLRYKIAYLLRPWFLYDVLLGYLLFCGLNAWVVYIGGPERDALKPHKPQFELFAALSGEFQAVLLYMSLVLLLSVIRTMEYMVLQDELSKTYIAMGSALKSIAWFMVPFVVLFGGFIISGHVLFGTQLPMFSDLKSTGQNMMLWLLAMGGGHEDLFARPGGLIFLIGFLAICMVLLFNIILAMVFMAFDGRDDIVDHKTKGDRPYNHVVADWLCDLGRVKKYHDDFYHDDDELWEDEDQEAERLALQFVIRPWFREWSALARAARADEEAPLLDPVRR